MTGIADVGSTVDPTLTVPIIVTAAAVAVAWWLGGAVARAASRPAPQPPEPPGRAADLLCANLSCDRLWTRSLHGWRLCDGCADRIEADYSAWEAEAARRDAP